jgi:adenylate cyclase
MTPEPTAVRSQLERILASASFATAGRHSRLLRYVVERTLAGEGDQLKEYVLGTEVFDRADSYDPRLDSIVRVEARRLRSRLDEYYQADGINDAIVITIPRGNYVPVFNVRDPAAVAAPAAVSTPAGTAAPTPAQPKRHGAYSPVTLIGATLTLALAMTILVLVSNREPTPAQASSGASVAVLPFEHYSTSQDEALLVAGLTDTVTAELARTGTVAVVSRTTAARFSDGSHSVPEIGDALKVGYVIEGSAIVIGEQLRVAIRLVDTKIDRKVWVGEYDFARTELVVTARRIAADSAGAIARR